MLCAIGAPKRLEATSEEIDHFRRHFQIWIRNLLCRDPLHHEFLLFWLEQLNSDLFTTVCESAKVSSLTGLDLWESCAKASLKDTFVIEKFRSIVTKGARVPT